jgi:hypothetical protein
MCIPLLSVIWCIQVIDKIGICDPCILNYRSAHTQKKNCRWSWEEPWSPLPPPAPPLIVVTLDLDDKFNKFKDPDMQFQSLWTWMISHNKFKDHSCISII